MIFGTGTLLFPPYQNIFQFFCSHAEHIIYRLKNIYKLLVQFNGW